MNISARLGIGSRTATAAALMLALLTLPVLGFSLAGATNITACGTFGAGSYVVINNISSSAINCLVFNAGPVTLDLNGFTVSGSGSTNGLLATNIPNVTVRNGTLRGFARGVSASGTGAVIDQVRAVNGSANGFTVGDNATVENSLVGNHSGGGIITGKNAAIIANRVSGNIGNLAIAIEVSDGSIVKGNTVTQNSGKNATAIQVTTNCKVEDNVISDSSSGIVAFNGHNNEFTGNTIRNCFEGITGGDTATISGNTVSGNGDNGIGAGADCLISGNTASNNGTVGIGAGVRTLYQNNVANGNGFAGLFVACPSKVAGNSALNNVSKNLDEGGSGCLNTDNLAP